MACAPAQEAHICPVLVITLKSIYILMAFLGNLMLSELEKFALLYKPIFVILASQIRSKTFFFFIVC